jgi:integrase
VKPKVWVLIYVTALAGLRRSEVFGLRWKAIDFEENKITINHTVTDARIDGQTVVIAADRTKTKSSYRSFPMSETVREKLLAWREVQQQNRKICGNCYNMDDIDYVFTDEMGNRFKPRYIEDAFPKLLKKHGLRKIRFHDLRHTCATLMHKMGLSPKEVQDYLGHSTVSVTLNIYTHLDWSSKENAAKVMEHAVKLPENMQISNPWKA